MEIQKFNIKLIMSDNEIDEAIEERIDYFLESLNTEEFENLLSASTISENFETLNEIIEPLKDMENELQNPSLKINKEIRKKIQVIIPKKKLNEEESNLIKDIKIFQKGYENNAIKTNATIVKIKNSFKSLSNSVSELIKLIENIKKKYFEHAKQLMTPVTEKYNDLKNFNKSKFDKKKLEIFESKNKKIEDKIKSYDQKLSNIIKELKSVFQNININIQGYLDLLNGLSQPINEMIDEIETIFNEFEEKTKKFIDIIYNNPEKKHEAIQIFQEMKLLNEKILNSIKKQENEMENKDKILKQKKEECCNDFNKILQKEKETNKKVQGIQNETKQLISEINDFLKFCSLPTINVKIEQFKGFEVTKIKDNIENGTNNMIKENEKIVVDFSQLKKHVNEENDKMNKAITIDLAFVMDITGSMSTYLNFARDKVMQIIEKITKETTASVNIGFIGYRDYNDSKDEYLIYPELTKDSESVKQFISKAQAGGGKDSEDMGGGLTAALNYKWKSNTRFVMLIADAPCHGVQYHEIPNFDSLPKGDPKYKIDEIIKKYAENDINLLCLNITGMTYKLYNNFVDYYKKGRKNENSASIFIGVFNEEKQHTDVLIDLIVSNTKKFFENRHNKNN